MAAKAQRLVHSSPGAADVPVPATDAPPASPQPLGPQASSLCPCACCVSLLSGRRSLLAQACSGLTSCRACSGRGQSTLPPSRTCRRTRRPCLVARPSARTGVLSGALSAPQHSDSGPRPPPQRTSTSSLAHWAAWSRMQPCQLQGRLFFRLPCAGCSSGCPGFPLYTDHCPAYPCAMVLPPGRCTPTLQPCTCMPC